MRIFLYLFLFVFLTAFFTYSALSAEVVKIKILADEDYPPYSYVEDGELKGIYVDIVKQAASKLESKFAVTLEPAPWKRALLLIEEGREFALIPPYKHFVSRPFIAEYSVPLANEDIIVYCHKDINLSQAFESSFGGFRPIRLGINAGYLILNDAYNKAIKRKRIVINENKSSVSNIMKLLKRRIDCYANDKATILYGLSIALGKDPTLDPTDYVQKDYVASNSAHIGYSRESLVQRPSLRQFIIDMDKALTDMHSTPESN